jgi:hypothetical protein
VVNLVLEHKQATSTIIEEDKITMSAKAVAHRGRDIRGFKLFRRWKTQADALSARTDNGANASPSERPSENHAAQGISRFNFTSSQTQHI